MSWSWKRSNRPVPADGRNTTTLSADSGLLSKSLRHQSLQSEPAAGCIPSHHFLHVFRDQIDLQIDRVSLVERGKIGHLDGVRNDGGCNIGAFDFGDSKADAFDRERPLENHIAGEIRRNSDVEPVIIGAGDAVKRDEDTGAIDVALDDVSAETAVGAHGEFEVDVRARRDTRERNAIPGFGSKIS